MLAEALRSLLGRVSARPGATPPISVTEGPSYQEIGEWLETWRIDARVPPQCTDAAQPGPAQDATRAQLHEGGQAAAVDGAPRSTALIAEGDFCAYRNMADAALRAKNDVLGAMARRLEEAEAELDALRGQLVVQARAATQDDATEPPGDSLTGAGSAHGAGAEVSRHRRNGSMAGEEEATMDLLQGQLQALLREKQALAEQNSQLSIGLASLLQEREMMCDALAEYQTVHLPRFSELQLELAIANAQVAIHREEIAELTRLATPAALQRMETSRTLQRLRSQHASLVASLIDGADGTSEPGNAPSPLPETPEPPQSHASRGPEAVPKRLEADLMSLRA
ncbi:unnamed protein product [Pedinophyceae sp. YPF-701]|nr:unnamed protein product [Pedinophyceae sp. YPF-701]